jgi:hypothetical protein
MFVVKASSLPTYIGVEHLKGVSPALPSLIRLGWKGLPETNALAYYGRKKFYNIGAREFNFGG